MVILDRTCSQGLLFGCSSLCTRLENHGPDPFDSLLVNDLSLLTLVLKPFTLAVLVLKPFAFIALCLCLLIGYLRLSLLLLLFRPELLLTKSFLLLCKSHTLIFDHVSIFALFLRVGQTLVNIGASMNLAHRCIRSFDLSRSLPQRDPRMNIVGLPDVQVLARHPLALQLVQGWNFECLRLDFDWESYEVTHSELQLRQVLHEDLDLICNRE